MTNPDDYSLLKRCPPPRPLHLALAHCYAVAKAGDQQRQTMLFRLFQRLTWAEQQACRTEIRRCQHAMRGHILAEIVA